MERLMAETSAIDYQHIVSTVDTFLRSVFEQETWAFTLFIYYCIYYSKLFFIYIGKPMEMSMIS
jgi:hypothetical protein